MVYLDILSWAKVKEFLIPKNIFDNIKVFRRKNSVFLVHKIKYFDGIKTGTKEEKLYLILNNKTTRLFKYLCFKLLREYNIPTKPYTIRGSLYSHYKLGLIENRVDIHKIKYFITKKGEDIIRYVLKKLNKTPEYVRNN